MWQILKRNSLAFLLFLAGLPVTYFGGFHDWTQPTLLWYSFPYSKEGVFLIIIALYALVLVIEVMLREYSYYQHKKSEENFAVLQAEYDEIAQRLISYFEPIVRDLLQGIYDQLKFTANERITIYKVEDGHYWPIGRISDNSSYRKYHRTHYPKEQGCISKAWKTGPANYTKYPANIDKWCEKQEEVWSIPYKDAFGMTMKSRSMYALRVDKSNGDKAPLVVIVFESNGPFIINKACRKKIRDTLEESQNEIEKVFCDYHEYGPKYEMNLKDEGY